MEVVSALHSFSRIAVLPEPFGLCTDALSRSRLGSRHRLIASSLGEVSSFDGYPGPWSVRVMSVPCPPEPYFTPSSPTLLGRNHRPRRPDASCHMTQILFRPLTHLYMNHPQRALREVCMCYSRTDNFFFGSRTSQPEHYESFPCTDPKWHLNKPKRFLRVCRHSPG